MKKICIITFSIIFLVCIAKNLFASEGNDSFSFSIGSEAWYAHWKSESGLDELGAVLDYDIEPSIIYGYSASLNYNKAGDDVTSFILDYFTSKLEQEDSSFALEGSDSTVYEMLRSKINQRIGDSWYLNFNLQRATFKGTLTIKHGSQYFDVADGTAWAMNSKWFKADALFLLRAGKGKNAILPGIGYRYIAYEKPIAIIDFYGSEKDDSGFATVEADEIISGTIQDAQIKGHHLVIGVWDGSYIGLVSDSYYFFDFLFYIGSADIEGDTFKTTGRISAGWEFSLGLKYSHNFSDRVGLNARLGLRYLHHKLAFAEDVGQDAQGTIWRGAYIEEKWFGPFLGVTLTF